MNHRAVSLCVLVVLAGVLAAPAAGASSPEPGGAVGASSGTAAVQANNTTNVSLGASISAFMQSSVEGAKTAVSQRMWNASFHAEDADKRVLAGQRVERLGAELANVTEQRRKLVAKRRAGEISQVTFVSRMSALQERYRTLNDSVTATARVTERAAVEPPGLSDLKRTAKNASRVDVLPNVTLPGEGKGRDGRTPGRPTVTLPTSENNTTVIGNGNGNGVGPGENNGQGEGPNAGRGNGRDGPPASNQSNRSVGQTVNDTVSTGTTIVEDTVDGVGSTVEETLNETTTTDDGNVTLPGLDRAGPNATGVGHGNGSHVTAGVVGTPSR